VAKNPDIAIGSKFARWSIVDSDGSNRLLCRCECGVERSVARYLLVSGGSKSCGCLRRDRQRERSKYRGASTYGQRSRQRPEYAAWYHAIQRCHDKNCISYPSYGGRGILVCERWRNSFLTFLADIGSRPGRGYSLDRIDNDKGYEPSNCRWATDSEQQQNKRSTPYITFDGKTLPLAGWAIKVGVSRHALCQRLRNGWNVERALTTRRCAHMKVTPQIVTEIRQLGASLSNPKLAARFGVSETLIRKIRNRQRWGHVP
jgi:hypothetical protein